MFNLFDPIKKKEKDYQLRIASVMKIRCPKINESTQTAYPWKYLESRWDGDTYQIAYHVPVGYSAKDLIRVADALRAACGCEIGFKDLAGVVVVNVITKG